SVRHGEPQTVPDRWHTPAPTPAVPACPGRRRGRCRRPRPARPPKRDRHALLYGYPIDLVDAWIFDTTAVSEAVASPLCLYAGKRIIVGIGAARCACIPVSPQGRDASAPPSNSARR